MIETFDGKQSTGFSRWLRTGKLPSAPYPSALEHKFNPWHDPADGPFTFAGGGRRDRTSGTSVESRPGSRASARGDRAPALTQRSKPRAMTLPKAKTSLGIPPATESQRLAKPASPSLRPARIERRPPGNQPNPVSEFVGGVGQGLHDVGKGTVAGVRAALTTPPATTVRNAGRGLASMIDAAIAAEDAAARITVSRAASAVASASAREIGRATGTIVGNAALAAAPGAALSKVSRLNRLRATVPRTTYDPPQIGWVKETTRSAKPWKHYNDAATGARPGEAPTLMRTMPDGSKRPVKFDGVQGDYVIDRKWKVVDAPRARAQVLRQSTVLAEHRLIGTWEVPTLAQKDKGVKLFRRMNVTNIHVRVVKP